MARTPEMSRRSQLRHALLQAVRSAPGTRVADLEVTVDEQPVPPSTARQVATELTHDGLIEASISWAGRSPDEVVVKHLTPMGRRYLDLLAAGELE